MAVLNKLFNYAAAYLALIIFSMLLSLSSLNYASDKNACALSKEEVSDIIDQDVTETFKQGNWGIASTCTYSTKTSPAAVMISSVASTDLSTDRMYEGYKELEKLGDEAVWVPAVSTLTVADKEKKKLLRIKIDLPNTKEEKLTIAIKIAELALKKL